MENLIKEYQKSFEKFADLPAMTDFFSGKTYSFADVSRRVSMYQTIFREHGINKGDKIAIIGRNSIEWITSYISILTYGAVVVPILPDFNPIDMAGIVAHSDARLLFADKAIMDKLLNAAKPLPESFTYEEMPKLELLPADLLPAQFADVDQDDLVIISYTSGTTGSSKGVMLPLRSIQANVDFAVHHEFHFESSRVLALLPLAHAYGCAFDLLTPLVTGSHMYVLGKTPTPRILMDALAKVKPHLLCMVPMVIEKVVRKVVLPKLEAQPVKTLLKIPFINTLIYKKVRKQMMASFGGSLKEINMGGGGLDPEVERFLMKIHFPFTVGYGMTETGPLVSYLPWRKFIARSCGKLLDGFEIKLDGDGYGEGVGEICLRGRQVMLGYYKNPEATAQTLRDGWMHTGDIGYVDKNQVIYLRGRCKNMILTSAGQNIYPEEIEGKLNNLPMVAESLVYEEDGKLFALVVPDADALKQCNGDYTPLEEQMKSNLGQLNTLVAPYEKVVSIRLLAEAFEKTPKQSIKRFLYPEEAKYL